MLKVAVILFFIVFVLGLIIIFVQRDQKEIRIFGEGLPLFLTEFIRNGSMDKGRIAAQVHLLHGATKSFAGFLTVNEEFDSNLFFWYFPAEMEPTTAPVAMWLQSGPGVSSLYGLFLENGPYRVVSNYVKNREDYWSKYLHVIYIDCSVGTGFSFTKNESGYSTESSAVAENLYIALQQFFRLFPEIRNNDFYVSGESYGGKYVPELSRSIHQNNLNSSIKINLKGLTIGNGLIDPIHQMIYSNYLHGIALIDGGQKPKFNKLQSKVIHLMKKEKWLQANHALSDLISGEFGRRTLFTNETGFKTFTNYLVSNEPADFKRVDRVIKKDWLRRKIHVGNLTFTAAGRNDARRKLDNDLMKPSGPSLAELMNQYKVLLYSGQLDIFLAYDGTENALKRFLWCGSASYKSAKRNPWFVDGILAGYTKIVSAENCTGELMLVLVRNAGHYVAKDQPVWALDLIVKFMKNITFN